MHILIADDSMLARMVLKDSIPVDGIEVHEAVNGRDALEKFSEIAPDILFLDLTMPEMSGEEVLMRLGGMAHKARIFVISADVQQRTMERILSLGAAGILKKPPSKSDILSIVEQARKEL